MALFYLALDSGLRVEEVITSASRLELKYAYASRDRIAVLDLPPERDILEYREVLLYFVGLIQIEKHSLRIEVDLILTSQFFRPKPIGVILWVI